jgi:UDP-glucuronate 4-epimerase
MNFLVTGGAGFIGSHVCQRLLESGHSVWAYDDLNGFYAPELKRRNLHDLQALGKPFEFKQGDLTNRADVDELFASVKFDQVIHLAARAGVRPSLEEPALYQRVNVEGTVNLLEAARTRKVRKVIIASSSSVYGVNSKVPFCETDPIFTPISPYAASKLACEALGHVYHHVYGFDVAMLRFFTVYGPRQRPDLAIYKFARLILRGEPLPVFGDGSTARDYTYVTDTLEGVIACTHKEFGYEIFNLGESHTVKLNRLIELLETALGRKAVIQRLPPQPGDVPLTCADITKAKKHLGYRPQVPIEKGFHCLPPGSSNTPVSIMQNKPQYTRPAFREALASWVSLLKQNGMPSDLVWLFDENLCFEKDPANASGYRLGFQTVFTPPPAEAAQIAYDHFAEVDATLVWYRLGYQPGQIRLPVALRPLVPKQE